jgi:hypothetical protein
MGNRSYLYLKNPKREHTVFEANNSLPFFWIAILNKNILIDQIRQWKNYEQFADTHTEEETEDYLIKYSNNITIDQNTFNENAIRSRTFLRENFPESLPLFDDFVKFINQNFEADDRLEMDITQYTAFYASLDHFYNDLTDEMDAIETNQAASIKFLLPEDLIASGSGFQSISTNQFSNSPAYQKAQLDRTKTQQPFNRNAIIVGAIILLICPLFSYWAYHIYTKDGFNSWVFIIGFLNLLFYIFSISTIVLEIKAYQKKSA